MPDTWRGELIEGDLVMAPSPSGRHSLLVARLHELLLLHLGRGSSVRALVAPSDVDCDRHNVLQPDLFVLREEDRLRAPDWRIAVPLWVAEVLSPKTAKYDRGTKMVVYARSGVAEAWIVDPRTETVEVRDLLSGARRKLRRGETAESRALPGFRVPLDELFAP